MRSMRTIYISSRNKNKNYTWIIAFLMILIIMVLCLRVVAPYAAEAWINEKEPNEKGFVVKVADVDLKLLKGEVFFNDVEVNHVFSRTKVAQAEKVRVDFNLLNYLFGDRTLNVFANHMDLILTKGILEEFNHIKTRSDSIVKGRVDKINIRLQEENVLRTITTLNKTDLELRRENFSMNSFVNGGGKVTLNAKTSKGSPWVISGHVTDVKSDVLSRLAGDDMPIKIGEGTLNAEIQAQTAGDQLEGVIKPDSKDVKLVEEAKPRPRWATPARRKEYEPLVLEIPFTLKENISLNFEETVNELRRRNL